MSEPQMMAACPKYDEKRGDCNPCRHSAKHEFIFPVCDIGEESELCPACTPLATPATQPPRLSARERINEEYAKEYFGVLSPEQLKFDVQPKLNAAAERVIAACDTECDALRETLHSERERLLAKNTENVAWWREEVETKIRYGIKMETQLHNECDALRERLKLYVNAWEPGGNPWEQRQRAEKAEAECDEARADCREMARAVLGATYGGPFGFLTESVRAIARKWPEEGKEK